MDTNNLYGLDPATQKDQNKKLVKSLGDLEDLKKKIQSRIFEDFLRDNLHGKWTMPTILSDIIRDYLHEFLDEFNSSWGYSVSLEYFKKDHNLIYRGISDFDYYPGGSMLFDIHVTPHYSESTDTLSIFYSLPIPESCRDDQQRLRTILCEGYISYKINWN